MAKTTRGKTKTKRAKRSSVDWGALAPQIAHASMEVLRERMHADARERMALIAVMQRMADALQERPKEAKS